MTSNSCFEQGCRHQSATAESSRPGSSERSSDPCRFDAPRRLTITCRLYSSRKQASRPYWFGRSDCFLLRRTTGNRHRLSFSLAASTKRHEGLCQLLQSETFDRRRHPGQRMPSSLLLFELSIVKPGLCHLHRETPSWSFGNPSWHPWQFCLSQSFAI
jgi:hypothetical protein